MKKNDFILIVVLVVVAIISYITIKYVGKSDGGQVEVVIDGNTIESFSLNEDITFKIVIDEENYNILEIKEGVAKVIEADCPDKLCVSQSSINEEGESIICLPHKLVVRVVKTSKSDVDAIAN